MEASSLCVDTHLDTQLARGVTADGGSFKSAVQQSVALKQLVTHLERHPQAASQRSKTPGSGLCFRARTRSATCLIMPLPGKIWDLQAPTRARPSNLASGACNPHCPDRAVWRSSGRGALRFHRGAQSGVNWC